MFLSMFMLMPLLSVEVLFFICVYNDNHLLDDWAQYIACCLQCCCQCNHEAHFNKLHLVEVVLSTFCFIIIIVYNTVSCKYIVNF